MNESTPLDKSNDLDRNIFFLFTQRNKKNRRSSRDICSLWISLAHTADAQSGLDIKFITSPRDLVRGERRRRGIGFVKWQTKGNDSIDLPRSSRETRLPINNRLLPRRPTREIGRSSAGFYGPRLDREPAQKNPTSIVPVRNARSDATRRDTGTRGLISHSFAG